MDTVNNSATVVLDTFEQQVGSMIVNGVPVGGSKVKVHYCKCSNCNISFKEFDPQMRLIHIMQDIEHTVKQQIKFCPNCGKKLTFVTDVIDVTINSNS